MGRLIDADLLAGRLQDFVDWCRDERKQGVAFVLDCPLPNSPTVEAISKDQYEARLKADMVAMLTDIQLELEEKSFYYIRIFGKPEDEKRVYLVELDDVNEVIQEKIDKLRGEKSG